MLCGFLNAVPTQSYFITLYHFSTVMCHFCGTVGHISHGWVFWKLRYVDFVLSIRLFQRNQLSRLSQARVMDVFSSQAITEIENILKSKKGNARQSRKIHKDPQTTSFPILLLFFVFLF